MKVQILPMKYSFFLSFFKKDFIYLSLEREREGEREGEKHQCVVASRAPQLGTCLLYTSDAADDSIRV